MITPYLLGHVILLLVPAAISALLFWFLFKKKKLNPKYYWTVLIPGLLIWLISWFALTLDLIVVNKDLSIDHYMVFSHPEYTAADGQHFKIERDMPGAQSNGSVFIVNLSESTLGLETIGYGDSPFSGPGGIADILPPHRTMKAYSVPDDFPLEEPPSSVRTSKSVKQDTRHWLRVATPEQIQKCLNMERELVPVK